MADADSDVDNDFPFNIYSPIDPRFNNYNAYYNRTGNEDRNVAVNGENSVLKQAYTFNTSQYDADVGFSQKSASLCDRQRLDSQSSIVDGLLSEIYDRWHDHRHDSFDSDTFTECSSTSEFMHWRRQSVHLEVAGRQLGYLHRGILQDYGIMSKLRGLKDLKNILVEMSRHVSQMSAKLVRQLKRRERRMSKLQNNCDIVTAIIQASSPKRRIDTRMKFSVEPSGGDSAFEQWKDAMKAVARLPLGIPAEFRKKVWLSLADHHIRELKIDWDKTVKFAFNERSNPDDNKLGLQIVKKFEEEERKLFKLYNITRNCYTDLHRTGCSGFSGEDNEEERALLKRILLAYARWNKVVGYCQGFNMIAALLLEVMDRKESDALKVMIYLIDHVLPQGYFANNLRALSVDMAVFRDLLKIFPKLSRHLDYLQHAQDQASGGCYEPPLTNVFTMQWFLTLFATCLPKPTVLRVWDSILLDGSEILLRTALVIWGKLSSRILTVSSADEFYTLMGDITQEMLEGNILDADSMIKSIYCIAPFPLPQLTDLREKYTYNIRPFTPASKKPSWPEGAVLPSDEDDLEEEDLENISCFTGFIPTNVSATVKHHKGLEGEQCSGSLPDISSLGPGAYGMGPADGSGVPNVPAYMERMTTDISALKKQYTKLRQRQNQAHVILAAATARHQAMKSKPMMPTIETPTAMNHLFLHKQNLKGRNRFIAEGPRIANVYPIMEPQALTKQSKQSRNKVSQSAGDNKRKWNQKAKVEKKSAEEVPIVSSHSQIKTPVTNAFDNTKVSTGEEIKQATDDGVRQESDNSVKCDMAAEQVHVTDKTADLNIAETDISRKCVQRSLQHKDSGLGNSVSSPLFSSSSAENSPQHSSLLCKENGCLPTCGEMHGYEMSASKVVPVSSESEEIMDSNLSENYDNHVSDLTNIVKEVSGALSADWPKELDQSVDEINAKGKEDVGNQEDLSECDIPVMVKIDTYEDELDKCSGYIYAEVDDSVRASLKVKGTGDSKTGEIADIVNEESAGASGDHKSTKDDHNGAHIGDKFESALDRDSKDDGSGFCKNETNVEISYEDKAKRNCTETENVDRSPSQSPGHNLYMDCSRLCSSDLSKSQSIPRSNSSNSAASAHSSGECDNYPDVLSPGSSTGQASFEQYYINKKNLCSESSKGFDTRVRKTQVPKKAFNPFPVKHINQNRARTGIKLGLYKPSTLQEYERSLKGQALWGK